jgi:hypothetical protein
MQGSPTGKEGTLTRVYQGLQGMYATFEYEQVSEGQPLDRARAGHHGPDGDDSDQSGGN